MCLDGLLETAARSHLATSCVHPCFSETASQRTCELHTHAALKDSLLAHAQRDPDIWSEIGWWFYVLVWFLCN